MGFDVAGDVFGHQRGAHFLRLKRVDLLVQRAHLDALFVVERRPAQGAGQVVFGVFAFGAGVQDGIKLVQLGHGIRGRDQVNAHFSCFFKVGQTLASMRGCAASLGWMRSAWNHLSGSGSSPMPFKKKGTSAAFWLLATWV